MKSEKLTFINHQGQQLSAKLEFPTDQKPTAFAIFAHCFTCNKNLAAARNISRAMAANGIAVLRFDFAGLGESEGEFITTDFSTNITDILAAARFLEVEYQAPSLLIGHSLAGAAVIFAGAHISSLKGVVTIGTPSNPAHVTHLFEKGLNQIRSEGKATVMIGGRPFDIRSQFLDNVEQRDMETALRVLRKPLLVMHAPLDKIVNVDHAAKIYKAAFHPKSFISLDGADHILTRKEDASYVGEVIASWAKKYIPREPEKRLSSMMDVVARLDSEDQYTTYIKAGEHYLTADEPENMGGFNYGPSPYQLLSSALGSCTAITLQMYAKRKKWDLKSVKVHVVYNKIYAKDCSHCVESDLKGLNGNDRLDHIDRILEIEGNLDEKQRERLKLIANKCPVHRTLENKVIIHTKLKPSAIDHADVAASR